MSILLTGGAGYIGSHTCVEMLNAGYDIVVVDNYSNSSPEALKRVKELTGKDFPIYEADVCDGEAMNALFDREKIEAVIHFAGYKAVGESVQKPLMYYRNNLDSTMTLLEVMRAHGVKRLVFSSSATVYGMQEKMPLTEDMPIGGCLNPYGWTKCMIEQILFDVAKAESDWTMVLLRYFNPVGAHESGRIGENPNGIPNNLMPRITQAVIGKIPPIQVMGTDYPTPDGTCLRDYIHVVDLAKGHVCAIRYALEHTGAEAVNLGVGRGCSVREIIRAFEEATGEKVPCSDGPRRPGDAPVSYADASKALRLFGWKAEKSIVDMCRDSWRWQKQNPNGYDQ
ncbi:MAG TPA: UDP-glucose 4-epimerase GalE [Candidatus Ornithocaccomicrobium faecavium]|uniref:UDP-glucose 4-epimerase n=1 Tax=Candidatus Ornithocaccomicrobium faecavium TaxID=2840890 RepID=A0A9D1TCC2_9FIRM|nr:UDP-glucose 4-epimerase GalE [Clostridiales bacterium]HIV27385.1 UDP-glucose 4-epimerase GalE [Candidatus Ornithocaccomicrobium faecavium]